MFPYWTAKDKRATLSNSAGGGGAPLIPGNAAKYRAWTFPKYVEKAPKYCTSKSDSPTKGDRTTNSIKKTFSSFVRFFFASLADNLIEIDKVEIRMTTEEIANVSTCVNALSTPSPDSMITSTSL